MVLLYNLRLSVKMFKSVISKLFINLSGINGIVEIFFSTSRSSLLIIVRVCAHKCVGAC